MVATPSSPSDFSACVQRLVAAAKQKNLAVVQQCMEEARVLADQLVGPARGAALRQLTEMSKTVEQLVAASPATETPTANTADSNLPHDLIVDAVSTCFASFVQALAEPGPEVEGCLIGALRSYTAQFRVLERRLGAEVLSHLVADCIGEVIDDALKAAEADAEDDEDSDDSEAE